MGVFSALKENRKLLERIFSKDKELAAIQKELREETGILPNRKNDYIIATGHQPIPYYPGLLFKNFFTGNKAKKLDIKAFNFVVDSDQGFIKVPVPYKKEEDYRKIQIPFKENPRTVLAGFQPTDKKVKEFLHTIGNHLKTLDKKEFSQSFTRWKNEFMEKYNTNQSFIDALIVTRNQTETDLGLSLQDVKISKIAKTKAYYSFVAYIINHIERFREVYNFSVKRKSKGNYQPVKLIQENDGWIELPFWLVNDQYRFPVMIKKNENKIKVLSKEGKTNFSLSIDQKNNLADQLKNKILLYPKATTLTFMIRLFFCDLFVHGTGAVEYEQVNNDFIKRFFHLDTSLSFYAVTGNIYLPLLGNKRDHGNLQKRYKKNLKWLKEAERNPEDLLDKKTADHYKEKKKELALQMKNEKEAGNRKRLHQELERLNEEMKPYLKDQMEKTKKMLLHDKYILNHEQIFLERYYPYFIYPQNTLTIENFQKNISIKEYNS